jgi:hypothetical protein
MATVSLVLGGYETLTEWIESTAVPAVRRWMTRCREYLADRFARTASAHSAASVHP